MNKEINNLKENKQWTLYVVMQRTWKMLLILGIVGLISELVFMIINLIINGNQEQGVYTEIWLGLSMGLLLLSALIALSLYAKPYIKQLYEWAYGA